MKDLILKFWRLSTNKSFELQLAFLKEDWPWLNVSFAITRKCDHAGVRLLIEAPFMLLSLDLYDNRHWDYENKCWHTEESAKNEARMAKAEYAEFLKKQQKQLEKE